MKKRLKIATVLALRCFRLLRVHRIPALLAVHLIRLLLSGLIDGIPLSDAFVVTPPLQRRVRGQIEHPLDRLSDLDVPTAVVLGPY